MRADAFSEQGYMDGQRMWMRIMEAIEELRRTRLEKGEALH